MFYIRRVSGDSMLPALKPGQIVVVRKTNRFHSGDIVMIHHESLEKIKRITMLKLDKAYVEGDNKRQSTDSRHFGWIEKSAVRGKVIWPNTHLVSLKSLK